MALKFSANLSFMFTEVDLIDRFAKAKSCGFDAFEVSQPYSLCPEVILEQMGDLKCDLINTPTDVYKWGCASLPCAEEDFCSMMQKIIPYKQNLRIKKLHIMSGNQSTQFSQEDHLNTLVAALNSLLDDDYLQNDNVIGLIEPICPEVNDKYFLNSFDTAIEVLQKVNNPNVRLLLDIYHLHKITNDVKKYLEIYYPYAGHIQISQDPGRREPCAEGKIDYRYVFDFLKNKNHSDYIGLEYIPSGSTEDSLKWMEEFA